MNIFCPKHPKQVMRNLFVANTMDERKKGKATTTTGYLFCEKCNKCYKPKVTFK